MNTRAAATNVIYDAVFNGWSLSDTLPDVLKNFSDPRDQAFVQALCYGVCRWYFRLDAIAQLLLDNPLKGKERDIHILILIGLYQLIYMRVPDHAAVGETVSATIALDKLWAKGLVNGVLREYQRRAEELNEKISSNYEALYSHPDWIINKLKSSGVKEWRAILDANNQHPPFALRINQKVISREDYLKILQETAHIIPETRSGIVLENAVDVSDLPGFDEGHLSVQDGAAQLAAELLELEPGQRVLDACAAPGGKTTHMLELQPDLAELIAIDHDDERLESVYENLERLKLSAKCLCADAANLDEWWDGKLFDRILLDAPCSASGVIRRHPDIKLLRRASDIPKLIEEQKFLLDTIWQTLKPGGILLYATCSIFPEENYLQLKEFLETHADAKEEKIQASWGEECLIGRQIYPGMHGLDGFYYGRLRKSISA